MAALKTILPSFIGGEEISYDLIVLDGDGNAVDFTDYVFTASLYWEGLDRINLSEGDGLTVLDESPPAPAQGEYPNPQIRITLTEEQTGDVPIGRAPFFILTAISLADVALKFGPYYLDRRA